MEESATIVDNHYEVGMLWNRDNPQLPNNRHVAFKRLQHLKSRLKKDKVLLQKYREKIEEYVKKGYARKLRSDEVSGTSDVTWYLPHHPVVHHAKPGKIRIVFDAAAEFKDTSLNSNLLQGPNLANEIIDVLIRFRKEEVAVVADIQEMFHQVKVPEKDRDSLRFLWFPSNLDGAPETYCMNAHIFGAKDSPSIANFALQKTAKDNSRDFSKSVINAVEKDFYVDDLLKSLPNEQDAVEFSSEIIELLQRGGFRLTKFMSSSKKVLAAVPASERANPSFNLDLDKLPVERALGMQWNVEDDVFEFKVVDSDKPETKRGILSTVASLYDPLGLAAPVTLLAKCQLQRLWQLKVDWDAQLPETELVEWRRWKLALPALSNVRIPRCYKSNIIRETSSPIKTVKDIQLHTFSDASESGYGVASYVRTTFIDGTVVCALVFGKSRAAPLRRITIPRLELQAAVLAVRIGKMVQHEMGITFDQVCYWTDSEIVPRYIQNESKRYTVYVGNRVAEIREKSELAQWRFCPSKENPGDDASRGLISPAKFTPQCRWLKGPPFLKDAEPTWPMTSFGKLESDDPEVVQSTQANLLFDVETSSFDQLFQRYSSWKTLLVKVVWLTRFKRHIQNRHSKNCSCSRGKPSSAELIDAEHDIIRIIQRNEYLTEFNILRSGKDKVKASSSIAKLNPFIGKDDLLRVGSRLEHAPVSYDAIFPPILPKNHWVAGLIARHVHNNNAHIGQEHTLSLLRQRIWICRARSLIRRIINKCFVCRRGHTPMLHQQMANLPPYRVIAYEPPFTYVGADMFGPLLVKQGRSTVKRWGCIFTCMCSRAIHLEVAPSLEMDDFINVLRLFIARRGTPREIRTDCGTNFRGADNELKRAITTWNENHLQEKLSQRGITWIFNPPHAPHFSGVWERLIKDVKRALKAILKGSLVTNHVLQTVFAEVESILNSRPLTKSSEDARDATAISPAHLLLQKPAIVLPPGEFNEETVITRKKWRQVQVLANHFWNRWIKEYLTTLHLRQKWLSVQRNVRVGDLVLVGDKKIPRGQWPMAIITKVFRGRDCNIRTVELKTKDSVLVRPIVDVCLLEECNT